LHLRCLVFLYNAVGFLTYSIVPFCLIGIGSAARNWKLQFRLSDYSLACGLVSLIFVVLLFAKPKGPMIGLYQRIVEASILFWVIRTAFHLRKLPIDP